MEPLIKGGVEEMPLVSIVIPSFCHGDYISDCLSSISLQTYPCIELIIVDDASYDDSPNKIANFLQQNDSRFWKTHYIQHEVNQGLISTLREATQYITGKYIMFIASDDVLFVNAVESQVRLMEAQVHLGAATGNVIRIDSNGKRLPLLHQRLSPRKHIKFHEMLLGAQFPAVGAIIRTSAFRTVGGYPKDIKFEDWYLWLKLLDSGFGLFRTDRILAYYRIHSTNTHKNLNFMEVGRKEIIEKFSNRSDFEEIWERYTKWQDDANLSSLARYKKSEYVKLMRDTGMQNLKLKDIILLLLF